MRLRREQQVVVDVPGRQGARPARVGRKQRPHLEPADRRRVVLERHDRVARVRLERRLHHLHQRLRLLLAVDDDVAAEEPVPRVLAVGLRDVEELDVGGVALHVVAEEGGVVVEVPLVEREAHLLLFVLRGGGGGFGGGRQGV